MGLFFVCSLTCSLNVYFMGGRLEAKPRGQGAASRKPPVDFTLISLQRPLFLKGKRLATPRRVVLFASRPPLPHELGKSQGGRPWLGSKMNILRASPIKVNRAEVEAQESRLIERYRALTAGHVRRHYQAISEEARRFTRERVKPISRGAATPSLGAGVEPVQAQAYAAQQVTSARATEREDDDDEITPAERLIELGGASDSDEPSTPSVVSGQLCGGDGQPCCEQGFDEPCSSGLTCQAEASREGGAEAEQWRCLVEPDPCGGYAQQCCVQTELACLFAGLVCKGGDDVGKGGVCVMPPLPSPERRLKVGELKVIEVRGRFVEAEVTSDRLVGDGIHAVMKGDKAFLKGGR